MSTVKEMRKTWLAVEFQVDEAHEDLASWLMMDLGSSGCEVTKSDGKVLIHAVFDKQELDENYIDAITSSMELYGLAQALQTMRIQTILEEDWLSTWKQGFQPFPVGSRFLICPSWLKDTVQNPENRTIIFIEPAMAFGTGLHETTRYCIKALENLPVGETILDMGCGSAILAIAAAKLYPQAKIVACDIDDNAMDNSKLNSSLNKVSEHIELVKGSADSSLVKAHRYDTILSNLTAEDNASLLADYANLLQPNGLVIMAGILSEKAPLVTEHLAEHGFTEVHREVDGMWTGLVVQSAV